MIEASILAGIQTIIQSMAEFDNADVVINDWSVMDQLAAKAKAPYVVIQTAHEFYSTMETQPFVQWFIPVVLIEAFTDWEETLNNLSTRRDALLVKFNEVGSAARAAGGIDGVNIRRITSNGPIYPEYNPYLTDEELREAQPEYLVQGLTFETEYYY